MLVHAGEPVTVTLKELRDPNNGALAPDGATGWVAWRMWRDENGAVIAGLSDAAVSLSGYTASAAQVSVALAPATATKAGGALAPGARGNPNRYWYSLRLDPPSVTQPKDAVYGFVDVEDFAGEEDTSP